MPGKIFVVEDEPRLASLLADYLRQAGYEPHCIGDGGEVVSRVREQAPDLVLLDVMLPLIDGFELCRTIRADPALSQTRIVLVTARGREAEIARGLALGADTYLTKPFSTRDLMRKVRSLLAGTAAPGSAD